MKEFSMEELICLIVDGLLVKIQEEEGLTMLQARISLYSAKLYSELMDEKTKVWHLSVSQLYGIYQNEIETGIFRL